MTALPHSPTALFAAVVGLVLAIGALGAPWLAPHDPTDLASLSLLDSFRPPWFWPDADPAYPLGTDAQGRDLFSAILFGLRLSLGISLAAVALALALGLGAGLVAGYGGRVLDAVLMRVAEVQQTFPAILTALLIDGIVMAALPRAVRMQWHGAVIVAAIGLSLWPGIARTVRAATQVERHKDYVLASRVIGVPGWRILATHVLPNIAGPVQVLATLNLGFAILTEATLSYLGVGFPPTQPSLGTLIRVGSEYLMSGKWWVTIFPGAALVLIVLAVTLLGDWLRDPARVETR